MSALASSSGARHGALVLALALAAAACASTPSPLAPSLRGAVGAPNFGVQTDAVELPVSGKGFVRYRPQGANHFGRPRLVSALVRIAAELERESPGSPPIVIGDLSARNGGKIPGHQSHRTGRDVDILFHYVTPRGARVTAPGFIRVEPDGLARVPDNGDILRFDVEHQWRVMRALVSAEELGVQFLFVSRTIEALLVEYALALGEPLELVLRAQSVMLQPGDSMPHDDHVHVRIACSVDETVEGCLGGGPYWEWLPVLPPPLPLEGAALAALVADDPALELEPLASVPATAPLPTTIGSAASRALGAIPEVGE
ncbi:MAG TPA: penicillin-insensitive murein endopeptidase [Polyangiaceae bacterium]